MDSAAWSSIPAAIRQRAFFSATVEDARFLQTARGFLNDFLTQATLKLPDGQVAMKVGGRGDFVTQMKEFMHKTGVERSKDETITDIGGSDRLRLIFDTQVRMAHDFGNYKQGLDPEMLDQFPAWRFIRGQPVEIPRPVHEENEGVVRLKTDEDFWLAMNDESLGGFGVPYGPWGFNSGMDVEDVTREEAVALGLLNETDAQEPVQPEFNDSMTASTDGMDDDLVEDLRNRLGDEGELLQKGEPKEFTELDTEPVAQVPDPEAAPLAEPEPRVIAPLPIAATPLAQLDEGLAALESEPEKATELAKEIVADDKAAGESDTDPLAVLALAWALAWLAGGGKPKVAGPDDYNEEDEDEDGFVSAGDLPGHEFRGNQWTGGAGRGDTKPLAAESGAVTKVGKQIVDKILKSGVGSDHIHSLYSEDPQDEIATSFGLNTVRPEDIAYARSALKEDSQRMLREKFGEEFTAYRGETGTEGKQATMSLTLSPDTARHHATRSGKNPDGKVHEYRVRTSDVLGYSEAIGRGTFAEQEVVVPSNRAKTETGAELFHVTLTKNVPKIKAEGLKTFQTTNWAKQGSGERYGEGQIYAFSHEADAVRWAAKMDWAVNKEMGSGKVSVLKVADDKGWEADPAQAASPVESAGAKGKWLRRLKPTKAAAITEATPITTAHIKRMSLLPA